MLATIDHRRRPLSTMDLALRLIGILAAIGVLVFLSNSRNWTALFVPSGQISAGSKYGITVGDSEATVLRKLQAEGFKQITAVRQENRCFDRRIRGDKTVYAYEFNWRSGVVCVGLERGVAKEIAWHYNLLNP